jgi:hypothetical protein
MTINRLLLLSIDLFIMLTFPVKGLLQDTDTVGEFKKRSIQAIGDRVKVPIEASPHWKTTQ